MRTSTVRVETEEMQFLPKSIAFRCTGSGGMSEHFVLPPSRHFFVLDENHRMLGVNQTQRVSLGQIKQCQRAKEFPRSQMAFKRECDLGGVKASVAPLE